MKIFRSLLWFAASFAIAWIVIFTFIQPEFKIAVPAKIFTYQTRPYPLYFYVLAAFLAGIFFGLVFTLYYYFSSKAEIRKRSRKLKDANSEIEQLKGSVQSLQEQLESTNQELVDCRTSEQALKKATTQTPTTPAPVETDQTKSKETETSQPPENPE